MSTNKLVANRRNARRSTGPRTAAGLTITSRNAVRHGFYTAAVVPAAGESVAEFEELRSRVRDELAPEGEMAERLVERVALILWRFDRVARYEAAVAAQGVNALAAGPVPPDPDAITGAEVDVCGPQPAAPTPAYRLAHARARVAGWGPVRQQFRRAAAALGHPAFAGDPPEPPGRYVRRELAAVLGLEWDELEARWARVVAARTEAGPLAGAALEGVLAALAAAAGKEPAAVLAGTRERFAAKAAEYDRVIAEQERVADAVAAEMRAARAAALAAGVYADGDAVERVLRAEAHLTRQLGSTLDLLDRLRGGVGPADPALRLRRLVANG